MANADKSTANVNCSLQFLPKPVFSNKVKNCCHRNFRRLGDQCQFKSSMMALSMQAGGGFLIEMYRLYEVLAYKNMRKFLPF